MMEPCMDRRLSKQSAFKYRFHVQEDFEALPIVDIAPLIDPGGDEDAKQDVCDKLHAACMSVGFFYVINHGVSSELCQEVLSKCREWFHLPEETKAQLAISPSTSYRGYQALGANVTRYTSAAGAPAFTRDWHEAIDFFREDGLEELRPSPVHGVNQWPRQVPGLEAALRAYVAHSLQLGETIMGGIARGLKAPAAPFSGDPGAAAHSYWVMRAIHYPPLQLSEDQQQQHHHRTAAPASPPAADLPQGDSGQLSSMTSSSLGSAGSIRHEARAALEGGEVERAVQLSCGEHTDYGLLTLVLQEEGVEALQVRNRSGQWLTVQPLPGALVVNTGDMLRVLTGGLYEPTRHRVVNAHPQRSRVSLPFFYEPPFGATCAPVPQVVERWEAACSDPYAKPVEYGAHLEAKITTNFELR